ncbi:hypothetical protein E2C01_005863 [Portunus trituberculatus]|uniref:Uncharacterized protein n=1 Tax=Portunus trituberculatus TaxID=210409 RepID=A0A5B7CTS6_PORTR|nr:hypothetical protein [Portunus trituberculatus]
MEGQRWPGVMEQGNVCLNAHNSHASRNISLSAMCLVSGSLPVLTHSRKGTLALTGILAMGLSRSGLFLMVHTTSCSHVVPHFGGVEWCGRGHGLLRLQHVLDGTKHCSDSASIDEMRVTWYYTK